MQAGPSMSNSDSVARALLAREMDRAVIDKDVHAFFAPYAEWQRLVYNFYPWAADRLPQVCVTLAPVPSPCPVTAMPPETSCL